mmetsp:Transcript_12173/g.34439  ORF Transcript_12173/g.34439 Transcript_12173/m.34439 type:complete len:208 (+) Transcript_12173:501-1124(+)
MLGLPRPDVPHPRLHGYGPPGVRRLEREEDLELFPPPLRADLPHLPRGAARVRHTARRRAVRRRAALGARLPRRGARGAVRGHGALLGRQELLGQVLRVLSAERVAPGGRAVGQRERRVHTDLLLGAGRQQPGPRGLHRVLLLEAQAVRGALGAARVDCGHRGGGTRVLRPDAVRRADRSARRRRRRGREVNAHRGDQGGRGAGGVR